MVFDFQAMPSWAILFLLSVLGSYFIYSMKQFMAGLDEFKIDIRKILADLSDRLSHLEGEHQNQINWDNHERRKSPGR